MYLIDTVNTHNPSLIVLRDLGFEITIEPDEECETELGIWKASKGTAIFKASDPLSLLGLVCLWQHKGDNWKNVNGENLYQEIIDEVYGDE